MHKQQLRLNVGEFAKLTRIDEFCMIFNEQPNISEYEWERVNNKDYHHMISIKK